MCLWRASAAVLSHDHLSVLCVRMEIQVAGLAGVLAQELLGGLTEHESTKSSVRSRDSTFACVAVDPTRD